METDSLIAEFVDAVERHGMATEKGKRRVTNREYKRADRLEAKLLARGSEGRSAIHALMAHPNGWVRLFAASTCLGYDRDGAERVLGELEREPGFLGLNAKWLLKQWRAGKLRR